MKRKLGVPNLDDSFQDPDFEIIPDGIELDSSVGGDTYDFNGDSDTCNPFEKVSSSSSSFVNPFESEVRAKLPSECSESENLLNSTESFNPFAESSPNKSGIKETIEKSCPYCGKSFPSSYNKKQHEISVHKIIPTDMKIYKCDYKQCNFVTGSRVQFSRHTHSKQSQVEDRQLKPVCPVCHVQLFNASSLKRHMNRKHKTKNK